MRRASFILGFGSLLALLGGHVACTDVAPPEAAETNSALATDAGAREKLQERLRELKEKARRLKERCGELAKRGKEWIKNKDNQHKVCIASCDLANQWGAEFCDVVGVVCAVKIKIGWPLLFCLGAQQICDAGIQSFDLDKCKAMCDAKFGGDAGASDGGTADGAASDASTADASTDSGPDLREMDLDWSFFVAPRPPEPMVAAPPDAPEEAAESCEACDAELARLEQEIAEIERQLADTSW